MKKLISILLTACLLAGTAACGTNDSKPVAIEDDGPVYTSDPGDKFEIGMWVGVSDVLTHYDEDGKKIGSTPLTDAQFLEKYREIADAGFTVAFPGYEVMIDGQAYNLKALKAAKEAGIRQIIGDNTLRSYLMSAKTLVESGIATEAQVVERVREIIRPYTESEYASALYGFMIQDEPSAALFEDIGFAEKIFEKAAPELMFYVNLFPVIAGGAQLSGTSEALNYDTYLSQYLAKVKTDYISYDHYPLYGDGEETSLEASFLYNMDVMKTKIAEEGAGRTLWTFLQSIQFGVKNRKLEGKADAAFQLYSFLAYGGDCVQWFCYACPPPSDGATYFGNNALLDRDYNKTPVYDYVRETNLEAKSLMTALSNFTWKGVVLSSVYDEEGNFSYLKDSANVLASTDRLEKMESGEDAFAGVFRDKDGREGFLVVNYTDPGKMRRNEVTLTFQGYEKAVVIREGKRTALKFSGASLKLTLEPGEGAFVIPY